MEILNAHLPLRPWADPRTSRLPGIQPITDDSWITVCDTYGAQMAERDRLIADSPALVHALPAAALPAAQELYARVLDKLRGMPGFRFGASDVLRPDGVRVALNPDAPLLTLGRLVQEDLCLMQRVGDVHALTAAVLCFPASWSLAEKLGRGLPGVHHNVASYTPEMQARVQRLFDMIRPEQPLWRMNFHIYASADLFHPRLESDPHPVARAGDYLRAERQCLLRLPQTGAVLFSIHTYQVAMASLLPEDIAALAAMGKLAVAH